MFFSHLVFLLIMVTARVLLHMQWHQVCALLLLRIYIISLIYIVFYIASLFCKTCGYLEEITHLASTQYPATCLCVCSNSRKM